jgi:hypothetical protein
MKSVDLRTQEVEVSQLLHLAERESVLVIAPDGHEFLVAGADDFDAEVEALRKSARFQSFLDQRMKHPSRIPIEEIEREIEEKLRSA